MTPQAFLDHAEELAQDGRPAYCRSAVSRGYYAAHHAAVSFLFAVGVRTPADGTGHVAAFNSLVGASGIDVEVYKAGGRLMMLHGKRNVADYRWNNLTLEDQGQALLLVQWAREIITALDQCLADQDRLDDLWGHFRAWVPQHGAGLGLSLV